MNESKKFKELQHELMAMKGRLVKQLGEKKYTEMLMRFVCGVCGEYNADLNGAINIGKRILSYMDTIGAVCGFALNSDAVLSGTDAEKPIGFSHG